MMRQKRDIINKKIKLVLHFSFLFIFLISCNGQDKKTDKLIVESKKNNFIGKEFIIDQYNYKNDLFNSKKLDELFKKHNYSYLIGEYSGMAKENFHCKIIGLFRNNKYENSYALFYDKNHVLRDTLKITDKDISLDILFENDRKGIALGNIDTTNIKDVYFKITDLYEIDKNNIKLKKINLNQKIIRCEIPVRYLSEEYVGMEDYFNYGIQEKTIKTEILTTKLSDLKGMWAVICANELTTLDINEDEGFLSLYDFNAIYINLKVEKWSNNEYILKYASVSSQQNYYEDRLGIIDEDIDKNKPIGKLTILSDGKAKLDWTGLYNTKKQKLEFVGKDFLLLRENGGKIPLILERCD